MRKVSFFLVIFSILSCNKDYEIISNKEFEKLTIQDTLTNNTSYSVMHIGRSITDEFPKLLVKKKNLYLFERDCELKNDTLILSYYSAFIIDEQGSFRKNGIWVYTEFYTEGYFPFQTKGMKFSVDSIPKNWHKEPPTQEGIYFFENEELKLHSKEQSEEKFKEKEKNGFYFVPNTGRLFNTLNINELE